MTHYPPNGRDFLEFAKNCSDPVRLNYLMQKLSAKKCLGMKQGNFFDRGKIIDKHWHLNLLDAIANNINQNIPGTNLYNCIALVEDLIALNNEYRSCCSLALMIKSVNDNKEQFLQLAIKLFTNSVVSDNNLLCSAIQNECDELVHYFVDNHKSLLSQAVNQAIIDGKLPYVEMLVDSIIFDNSYQDALEYACDSNHTKIIDYLWSQGKGRHTNRLANIASSGSRNYYYGKEDLKHKWEVFEVLLKYDPSIINDPENVIHLCKCQHHLLSLVDKDVVESVGNKVISIAFDGYWGKGTKQQNILKSDIARIIDVSIDSGTVPDKHSLQLMVESKMFDKIKTCFSILDDDMLQCLYDFAIYSNALELLKNIDAIPRFNHRKSHDKFVEKISRVSSLNTNTIRYLHEKCEFTLAELNDMLVKVVELGYHDIPVSHVKCLLELGADISTKDYTAFKWTCSREWTHPELFISYVKDEDLHKLINEVNDSVKEMIKDEILHREICGTNSLLQKTANLYISNNKEVPDNIPFEVQREISLRSIEASVRELKHPPKKNRVRKMKERNELRNKDEYTTDDDDTDIDDLAF